MAELIDKGVLIELFEEKMFNSEVMCPVVKLAYVLEILEEQPTTTEAEIRAKAYDKVCNAISNLLSGDTKHLEGCAYYKELAYIEVLRMVEQLKEE